MPSLSGSFGILPNHVPTLAVLKPGVVTVHEADGSHRKYFGWCDVVMGNTNQADSFQLYVHIVLSTMCPMYTCYWSHVVATLEICFNVTNTHDGYNVNMHYSHYHWDVSHLTVC